MAQKAPRTPEGCPFRQPLPEASGAADHRCQLACAELGLPADSGLCHVRPDECEHCCRQRQPQPGWPNAMVASVMVEALRRIIDRGGVPSCDSARATALLPGAASHLLRVTFAPESGQAQLKPEAKRPYTGSCRFLGKPTGERACLTCRGNVRQKTFACHHPRHDHDSTTVLECRVCPDYEPGTSRRKVERWAVGMTTAPREPSTLRASLASLRRAGWDGQVHLFAEPEVSELAEAMETLGPLTLVQRVAPALGA